MANISKITKRLTGKELGNLVIKDVVLQITNPQDQSAFKRAELEGAINALSTDKDIRDYNNRIQIKNFLIEMVGRRDYAELLASKNSAMLSMMALIEKKYLQELDKPAPLRLTYAEYSNATKEKLEQYYTDENGKPRRIGILELLHKQMNFTKLAPDYKQALEPLEISYYREWQELDISDDGTAKIKNHRDVDKLMNLCKRIGNQTFETDKDDLQIIIDYIKQPDLFETEKPAYTTVKYTADELLCDLPDYINYLVATNHKDAIEPTMKKFSKAIDETIAHLENKKLALEMKRLSLYDLAVNTYEIREIAEKCDVDFSKEAWGNDDDNQTQILITPHGNFDDVRGDVENYTQLGSGLEQLDLNDTIRKVEESVAFCRGYNLMIDVLAEHLGTPELRNLKTDEQDLEMNKKMIYSTIVDLAKYCALINEYGHYLNKQTSDEIKKIVNTINQSVAQIKYIREQTPEAESERKEKMAEMLSKCATFGQRFVDIQNQFMFLAMNRAE